MKALISQLFLEQKTKDQTTFSLNPNLQLKFGSEQEAAEFLANAIRTWKEKGIFMDEVSDLETGHMSEDGKNIPEDKLMISYRYFRGEAAENYFVPVIKLIKNILPDFTKLSFVKAYTICSCGCGHIKYSFLFRDLLFFAKEGREGLLRREIEKREVAEQNEQARAQGVLDKLIAGRTVTDELKDQLRSHLKHNIIMASPNVAVFRSERSEYGSSGGCGYWSQVTCLCGNQKQMQEWQWRDRYSANNDSPWLCVQDLGKVDVKEENGMTTVKVELLNSKHGNRSISFDFKASATKKIVMLTAKEQMHFTKQAEQALEKVMGRLKELHSRKPTMLGDRGLTGYFQPRVKEQKVCTNIGVAAFVVEEQIDHREQDRQMCLNLYIFRKGLKNAELKAEDHGYDKREGGAFLTILEVNQDAILINTKSGKIEIKL